REVEEELKITPLDLEEMGELRFQFVDGLAIHCVVYVAKGFSGTPEETDEAIPEWFALGGIPYDQMWEDDQYWLPRMLGGEKFDARFDFDDEAMLTKQVEWR
ncbi:MAG: NUDIX hydrolase, partial [Verrucomicrobia bacterium]|nr:NUDIX hydrolase [Verrucomicrobiota bacterium]